MGTPSHSSLPSSDDHDEETVEETRISDFGNVKRDDAENDDTDTTLAEGKTESERGVSLPCSIVEEPKSELPDGPEILPDCDPVDGFGFEDLARKQHVADDLLKRGDDFFPGATIEAAMSTQAGKTEGPEIIFGDSGPFSLESDMEDSDPPDDKPGARNAPEAVRVDANDGAAQALPFNRLDDVRTPNTALHSPSVVVDREPYAPPLIRSDVSCQPLHSDDAITEAQSTDIVATPVGEDHIAEAIAMDPCLSTSTMKKHWSTLTAVLLLIVAAIVTAVVVTNHGSNVPYQPPSASPSQSLTSIRNEAITNVIVALSGDGALNTTTFQHSALSWLVEGGALDIIADDPRLIQRYVLALMYHSLGEDNWYDKYNFLSDANECEWSRTIECSNSVITQIGLSNNNLTGSLPLEIGALESLTVLSLFGNSISGNIPQNLTMWSSLQYVYLQDNFLTGSLPENIADMSSLRELVVYNNRLTGTIPTDIGNLDGLMLFAVHENMLEGSVPSEIGRLTKLGALQMDDNMITGALPSVIGQLTNLQALGVAANSLIGPIPSDIGRLTRLVALKIHDNAMIGTLPTDIGRLTNLQYWYANNNLLSGPIPSEIGRLTKLEDLALFNNELTGTLPTELARLDSLRYFWAYFNLLSGPIPSEIGRLTKIETFSIGVNELTGTLPTEIGLLTRLTKLYMDGNELSGYVPSSICNLHLTNFTTDCVSKINCSCCTECYE